MLVQFTVGNYRSFDGEQTLSMLATPEADHPKHVLPGEVPRCPAVLRAAVLYGANAAGKSNLVRAVALARRLVVSGTRLDRPIPVEPFRLGDGKGIGRPSKFQFIFRLDNKQFDYGFLVDRQRVHEEWLFVTPCRKRAQERLCFERSTSSDSKTSVKFGPAVGDGSAKDQLRLEFIADGTRQNQLFLTEAGERNATEFREVCEWFQRSLSVMSAESRFPALAPTVYAAPMFREFMSRLLASAGTGVSDVTVDEQEFDVRTDLPPMSAGKREEFEERIAELAEDNVLQLESSSGQPRFVVRGRDGRPMLLSLRLHHEVAPGRAIPFDLSDESDGTQRLVHLLPALFALRTGGSVLFLDELERRLHPLLTRMLVREVLNGDQTATSQAIFTTHDSDLLDAGLLRRDEVWFAEKDHAGATHLTSLAEYKIRGDLKLEKGYLSGRFGAIPVPLARSKPAWGPLVNEGASADSDLEEHTPCV